MKAYFAKRADRFGKHNRPDTVETPLLSEFSVAKANKIPFAVYASMAYPMRRALYYFSLVEAYNDGITRDAERCASENQLELKRQKR